MRLPSIRASTERDDKENAMDRRDVLKAAALVAAGVGLSPMSSKVRTAERISERRNPMSSGHDSIDAMIAKAQAQFPGYSPHLASGVEAHHDYVRFSWAAGGTAEAPLYIKGTDFAVIADDGRLKSVIGFTDAAPAPAAQQ
jgi:hypothetical protein